MAYGLRANRNYKLRDLDDPNWDWVYLKEIYFNGARWMVKYYEQGGTGKGVDIPAQEFRRLYRRMFDRDWYKR